MAEPRLRRKEVMSGIEIDLKVEVEPLYGPFNWRKHVGFVLFKLGA